MEVLTKSGLKSLWDKLKSSFILKKGGGTIVNDGTDKDSDTKNRNMSISHKGIYLNEESSIVSSFDQRGLLMSSKPGYTPVETQFDNRHIKFNYIGDNSYLDYQRLRFENMDIRGASLDGAYNADTIGIYISDKKYGVISNQSIYIKPTGITCDSYVSGAVTSEQLFNRTGSYKTIGVDIAPLKDGIIPLDNLPSLNYVPNNEASTIKTTSSYYNIGDERLLISKYEDTTYGDTGSFISLTPPTKDVPDGVKQGELKMVNTYEMINPITNIMSLTNELLSFTWITNDGTYNEQYTSLNAGNLTLSDSTGGRVQMWTRDSMEMKPKPTIKLVGDNSIAEYTDKGIYFQYK